MNSELDKKTARIQRLLAAENLGGVIINAQHNFAWLTGGRSNGINSSVENGVCSAFIRADGRRFLIANNIEMPRMLAEEISDEDFEPVVVSWQDEKASGTLLGETARSLTSLNKLIAADLILSPDIPAIENKISAYRQELTTEEVERFERLGQDAGEILGSFFQNLTPGVTEIEIARNVRTALGVRGIESVVTLVGADERIIRYRHPLPTANVWRNVVMIAVCAKRDGLIASLSRIACTDMISGELERRTEAAARVFGTFLASTKPGAIAGDIYRRVASAYAAEGFADEIDKHHQGGAAGYKTREWVAHPISGEIVRNHQAFAWNPSITGTKVEETVIVNSDKIKYLTVSPDFPQIAVEVDGETYFAPGILKL